MKRLFRIKDLKTDSVLPMDFSSKGIAKLERDLLEGPRDVDAPRRYIVTPGPDHRNWNPSGDQSNDGHNEERAA